MKRGKIILTLADQLLLILIFFFLIYIKPASVSRYLPENIIPFTAYFIFSLILSFLFKKYDVTGSKDFALTIWPIIKTNFIAIAFVSIVIFLFRLFSYSRLIIFGTIISYTIVEFILFTVYYIIDSLKYSQPVDLDLNKAEITEARDTLVDIKEPEIAEEIEILSDFRERKKEELNTYGAYYRNLIAEEYGEAVYAFIEKFIEPNDEKNIIQATTSRFDIQKVMKNNCHNLVNLERLNDIRRINKFLETINEKLPKGGLFIGCVESKELRKKRIIGQGIPVLCRIHYFIDYFVKRVWPKIPGLKKIYFFFTKGRNRVISKAETIGRLFSCGFKFVGDAIINGKLYFVAEKIKNPSYDFHASYGPIFKMRRVGKNGKEIYVFKFRTMYPYSEYVQEYIYEKNKLKEGGKIRHDFRISTMGRFLRKFWVDELPMFINVLKGDLKIVGVRPLSNHYLGLYSEELRKKRMKYKPGLIPPYYADMPKSIDEIMASEMKYLEAYEKHPFFTDMKYFFKAWINIIFRHARSE